MDLEIIKAKLAEVQDLIDSIEERKHWINYIEIGRSLMGNKQDVDRYKSDIARFETELTEKLKTLHN